MCSSGETSSRRRASSIDRPANFLFLIYIYILILIPPRLPRGVLVPFARAGLWERKSGCLLPLHFRGFRSAFVPSTATKPTQCDPPPPELERISAPPQATQIEGAAREGEHGYGQVKRKGRHRAKPLHSFIPAEQKRPLLYCKQRHAYISHPGPGGASPTPCSQPTPKRAGLTPSPLSLPRAPPKQRCLILLHQTDAHSILSRKATRSTSGARVPKRSPAEPFHLCCCQHLKYLDISLGFAALWECELCRVPLSSVALGAGHDLDPGVLLERYVNFLILHTPLPHRHSGGCGQADGLLGELAQNMRLHKTRAQHNTEQNITTRAEGGRR